jgi:hypothetical protein
MGHGPVEEYLEYIDLASSLGYTRIFTCLISLSEEGGELEDFKRIVRHAKDKNMQVISDVDPSVFTTFGITWQDLSFFSEMGLYGIRLDLGFSGIEESFMTYNPQGLKIEINMSNGTKYLDNILSYKSVRENLIGCHNFYPHTYTGLSRKHFLSCSKQFTDERIRTAAFISAPSAAYGPWPVFEGLCTLEEHRHLPIEVQAKDLFNTGLIDDVIIANCFATEEELRAVSAVDRNKLVFTVALHPDMPELEKKIVLEEPHFNRGDVSDYMVRSTQSRVTYKGHSFKLFNPAEIEAGDVLIESDLYSRYSGELQVALKPMKNSGKTNVVGRIAPEELFLLQGLEPWQKFGFQWKGQLL